MDKLDLILDKINTMDEKIDKLDERIDKLEGRIDKLDERMNSIDTDVKSIKLTLENEVRVNIMRVAEGHLDLSRNLKGVLKSNNEFEILSVKVNMLESDVRELKRKIS